jgi:hypothetical protein
MERIPHGSRLILQMPHTETLLGHKYYFNVPSHVAAYSPFVLRKMLARNGYKVVAEGSIDEKHAPGWKRRVRGNSGEKIIRFAGRIISGRGKLLCSGGPGTVRSGRRKTGRIATNIKGVKAKQIRLTLLAVKFVVCASLFCE